MHSLCVTEIKMSKVYEVAQLHIYNIANVAYGYCKILNEKAIGSATLVCHDTNHIMSQPEWDDQELDPRDFPDENNFFASSKMICYTRPEWYIREDIIFSSSKFIPAVASRLPTWFKSLILPVFLLCRKILTEIEAVWRKDYFDKLAKEDLAAQVFRPHVDWLKKYSKQKTICFAYATAPIYCYLYHDRPYVAVEIGTMREIPFESSVRGSLLAAAYQEADHIIITNPDVVKQAKTLGLTRYTFCPHPVDDKKFFPQPDNSIRENLIVKFPGTELIGIAPARQNWDIKGNHKYIEALRILRIDHGIKVTLVIPMWGQDVEKTQMLAKEYGVGDFIEWIAPLPESDLIKYYSTVDFVLDQFTLGVFGLITPKAMACNATVITSYNQEVHAWCFLEHPPLLRADSSNDIVNRVLQVKLKDAEWKRSKKSRDWFLQYHSKDVVLKVLCDVAREAGQHFEKSIKLGRSQFSNLWQGVRWKWK